MSGMGRAGVGGAVRHSDDKRLAVGGDDRRKAAATLAVQNKEKIKSMFLKYDKDNDQKLSISELRNMLAEISGKDPADITSHEVSFALRMADTKNQDGEIDRDEAAGAIAAWNVLQQDQDFWGARFEDFASTEGSDITQEQLMKLLVELNGNDPVTEKECASVFRKADMNKNGTIDRDEMRVAVAIWYTHVNFVKQEKTGAAVPVTSRTAPASGCCTLM